MAELAHWAGILIISLLLSCGVLKWAGIFRKPDPATQRLLDRIEQQHGAPIYRRPPWLLSITIVSMTACIAIILDAIL